MFDIGFTEILLIAVVSLVLIGPERLPETVRTVALWIGRVKRGMRDARKEIEAQIGADDIRRQLHNEEIMQNLKKIEKDAQEAMHEMEEELQENLYPPGHFDQPHIEDPLPEDEKQVNAEETSDSSDTANSIKPPVTHKSDHT